MTHTYIVTGMTCTGCLAKVQNLLSNIQGVTNISIDLAKKEATIDMDKHISIASLKAAFKDYPKYHIEEKNGTHQMESVHAPAPLEKAVVDTDSMGKFYCPMHCEGSKTYDKPGNCPVCGMNLVKQASDSIKEIKPNVHQQTIPILNNNNSGEYYCPMHCEGNKTYDKPGYCPVCGMNLEKLPTVSIKKIQYTCPMHPEIVRDAPGSCPICGMNLVPMEPVAEDEDKTYNDLLKKFKVSVLFTVPILLIAMSDMLMPNPLFKIVSQDKWNWIQFALSLPVIFYSGWMFFQRAWRSVITWNLNMFTLIGIGTGVAFLFSIVAMLFPHIFPAQFKTHSGTVFVYFEAATVILTLVLLGQLLEARAHSKTSGAIKELLKLVPADATLVVDKEERTIPIDEIKRGDLLRVKPGEKIPVDGKIVEGEGSIDESMITGEPIPADKKIDDKVTSGTLNTTRSFIMQAEKIGSETLLSQTQALLDAPDHTINDVRANDILSEFLVPYSYLN